MLELAHMLDILIANIHVLVVLSDPFEKLYLKFIEETLGVNCKASNDACRAELARLPRGCL
jgi:hypothetical protein